MQSVIHQRNKFGEKNWGNSMWNQYDYTNFWHVAGTLFKGGGCTLHCILIRGWKISHNHMRAVKLHSTTPT